MTNTTGQRITPAVKFRVPVWPNSDQLKGWSPSVVSTAKILMPTNSARIALATKMPARTDEEPGGAVGGDVHGP